MKTLRAIVLFMFFALLVCPLGLKAVDWSRVVNLEGSWHFTVGDDPSWANPTTIINDWDHISVPSRWEHYYPGYNGYAWYRRDFEMKTLPSEASLVLFLGRIDDADEVFINGQKVGQTGSFFPNYKSAWNVERRYAISSKLLRTGKNTIAVRVYDEAQDGGICGGSRIGLYFDNDLNLLELDLSGKWKFSTFREKGFSSENFDDARWADINVPAAWESQGYSGYDGSAWYRKKFELPAKLKDSPLYLVLGKIDDQDKVYINGELIGQTEDLERYRDYNRSNSWLLYRAYPIPKGLLKAQNVIVVQVYDRQGNGGIYEGPVGLISPEDARSILNREPEYRSFDGFWSIIDYLFD